MERLIGQAESLWPPKKKGPAIARESLMLQWV
jgi:hypothetical protein